MIVVKGSRVSFELESGKTIRAAGGLMHDIDGKNWPKCSALIGPFQKTPRKTDPGTVGRQYFGREYESKAGQVNLPPRDLSKWEEVGTVTKIWYQRSGTKAPGYYVHGFKGRSFLIFKRNRPKLYRYGRFMRCELGSSCVWNWRGFVSP